MTVAVLTPVEIEVMEMMSSGKEIVGTDLSSLCFDAVRRLRDRELAHSNFQYDHAAWLTDDKTYYKLTDKGQTVLDNETQTETTK